MSEVYCEGWWEQTGFGRQPMEQLCVQFDGGIVSGSGADVIGPFTITGRLEQDRVVLVKRYLGLHSVDYKIIALENREAKLREQLLNP